MSVVKIIPSIANRQYFTFVNWFCLVYSCLCSSAEFWKVPLAFLDLTDPTNLHYLHILPFSLSQRLQLVAHEYNLNTWGLPAVNLLPCGKLTLIPSLFSISRQLLPEKSSSPFTSAMFSFPNSLLWWMLAKAVWVQQIVSMCSSLPWQTVWIRCCGRAALERKYFLGWCYLKALKTAVATTPHLPQPLEKTFRRLINRSFVQQWKHLLYHLPGNTAGPPSRGSEFLPMVSPGIPCNVILNLVVFWFNYA